jgi:hypothetical protein
MIDILEYLLAYFFTSCSRKCLSATDWRRLARHQMISFDFADLAASWKRLDLVSHLVQAELLSNLERSFAILKIKYT